MKFRMKKIIILVAPPIALLWFPVAAYAFTISFEQPELIYIVVFEKSGPCQKDFQIACDVLEYLKSNPDASDSIEKVAASWTEVDDLSVSSENVDGVSTFSLDRESGELTFGDGEAGARTPSGTSVTLGTYTYGGGVGGSISTVNIYYFPVKFYSFLIPQDVFPKDDKGNTVYEFLLSGIASLEYEIKEGDLFLAKAAYMSAPVPEPASLLLLGSGLAGMIGLRRKWQK